MAPADLILQSFVPSQLLRWLATRDAPDLRFETDTRELVLWSADLSDFTRLTNEITERQRSGPEAVTERLNDTFGAIIESIARHGGEVFGFGGDSVLATWRIDPDRGAADAIALAGLCGLDVRALRQSDPSTDRPAHQLRIGVGVGTVVLMQLGGVGERWHFTMGGPPFAELAVTADLAGPGEVVFTPDARRIAGHLVRGDERGDGFLALSDVDATRPPDHGATPELTPALERAVEHFVPHPVVNRIAAGQSEWLAEFRRITSVFVNLPSLDTSDPGSLELLNDVVRASQRALVRYEGTLTRVLVDDKGVTLMAAFGLPPYAHEEDPYRAVQASKEIEDALTQMRLEYGIGIATGRAYCGAYGSARRRDYTTVGREVNLAARLMQAARFEILCDDATAKAARRIEFLPLDAKTLKGWDQPVTVHRPLWDRPSLGDRATHPAAAHLVGREHERTQIDLWLSALADRTPTVVVIEGEAGIGKTALAAEAVRAARAAGVECLVGAALPVAQTPYQAWRSILGDVLGLTALRSVERRQDVVHDRLSAWPQLAEREALLNSVLDLDFPETESTRAMTGKNRRDATVELITTLLQAQASRNPLLILLDDVHWLDSASWAVVHAVARKVSPVLLVLLSRPTSDPDGHLAELSDRGSFSRMVLNPIDRESVLAIARDVLGVRELAPDVGDLIADGAEGIPFYVEEMAHSLQEAELIAGDRGVATLRRPTREFDVPPSLTSVVLSRIDHLEPELQLTLKVASVIGRSFGVEALHAVHPGHPPLETLEMELSKLADLELVVESSAGSFDFKHSLIRDAAYDLLLFDQRRRIHREMGLFLESQADDRTEPPYALLAYHWDRGEDHEKALENLERSGNSAFRKGAYRETIDALTRALELTEEHAADLGDIGADRRSGWHVEIGQAHEALGHLDEAERSLMRALDLLGVHIPDGRFARAGRFLWELAKQIVHVALPVAVRVPDAPGSVRKARASRVAGLLGEVYFFSGDVPGYTLVNLIAVNLGEKAGEPMVAGLAYSNLGYLVGTLRLRRLARRYFGRARAEPSPDSVSRFDGLDLQEMVPGHLISASLSEGVMELTFNDWDRARSTVAVGLEICDRLGDTYSAGIALAVRGFGDYFAGNLTAAVDDYERLLRSARERSNREHEGWATSFVIPVLLALGRNDAAQEMADAANELLGHVDPLTIPVIHASRSQVHLVSGRDAEALSDATQAVRTIDSSPIFIYLAGFDGMLDTLLELWSRAERGSPAEAELQSLVATGLGKMRSFSMVLPFARPKYLLFKGRARSLKGRRPAARRALAKGLGLARRNGAPWDEGRLALELARTYPPDSSQRRSHLDAAKEAFESVGSLRDLTRLERLSD